MREAEELFHRHLKRVGLKLTEQRDTILRTFLATRDHLSTEQLHRLVQQKDQGIGVTALQVASVYATLANGGVRVTPNLVAATLDRDGRLHHMPAPARHRVISQRTA